MIRKAVPGFRSGQAGLRLLTA